MAVSENQCFKIRKQTSTASCVLPTPKKTFNSVLFGISIVVTQLHGCVARFKKTVDFDSLPSKDNPGHFAKAY